MKAWWQKAKAKGQELVDLYGNIAIGTMIVLMVSNYTLFYVLIDKGVELDGAAGTSGKAAAAFAAYKVLMPVRIALAAILTPFVARVWWRIRPPTPPKVEDKGA